MDVVSLFKELLRFKSITPDDDGAMEFIKEYLKDFEIIQTQKRRCGKPLYL